MRTLLGASLGLLLGVAAARACAPFTGDDGFSLTPNPGKSNAITL